MHHVVDAPQDGQRIALSVGDSLELRLPQSAAKGLRWSTVEVPAGVVVHRQEAELTPSLEPAPPSAARTGIIELVATHTGDGPLRLTLARPWDAAPERTLTVTLAVN